LKGRCCKIQSASTSSGLIDFDLEEGHCFNCFSFVVSESEVRAAMAAFANWIKQA
jgi:hypothetical protein